MDRNNLKTYLPLIMGFFAGLVSFYLTGELRSRDPLGIIVLVFAIYLHKFILPRFGAKIETKDWAGLGFLTLATWYISWTLLLNL